MYACHLYALYDFNSSVSDQYIEERVGLVCLCSGRLPEDGIRVSKHIELDTCHGLYFVVCIFIVLFIFHCIL